MVTDLEKKERKREQNRIAQRNYREITSTYDR